MHYRAAYILLLLTTLFWGGNSVAGKLAVGHISPMLLTAIRWLLAFAILIAMGWPRLKADWPAARPHLMLLFTLGVLGFSIFNVAFYSALVYTSAINVSIEQAGVPMVIFLLNFILFRLRVTWLQIVGLLLSIVGVVITASHGDPRRLLQLDVNFGDALMLVAILVYALYTIALRFKPTIHWQSLMIVLCGAAFVTTIPFVIAEFAVGAGIIPDARGWAAALYTVIFPSILSQVFYIRSVDLIGANRAGLFINLVPVFGTVLSVLLLGEEFFAYHFAAIVLTLGGIALAELSGRKLAP